jgi:hypothetical protein
MKNLLLLILTAALLWGCGTTEYMAYSGAQQNWPTAPGAMVGQGAVPVYYGWPPRPYKVLGEVASLTGQDYACFDLKARAIRAATEEAKKRGADAVIVMSRESQVTGSYSFASASWNQYGGFGSGFSAPVGQGSARVTAIKFL